MSKCVKIYLTPDKIKNILSGLRSLNYYSFITMSQGLIDGACNDGCSNGDSSVVNVNDTGFISAKESVNSFFNVSGLKCNKQEASLCKEGLINGGHIFPL